MEAWRQNLMNTRAYEAVIALSEEGTQTRAAERLMISQSALSQIIKKTENEVGTSLFTKKSNNYVLTDAGKIYVNGARAVLQIYQNALHDISRIRTRKRKEISIVYNRSLLKNISQVIAGFIAKNPNIYIKTIYGNASAAVDYLLNGQADIAVVSTKELSNSLLSFIPLRDEELKLVLPFGHPAIHSFLRNGIHFDALEQDFFVLHQEGSFLHHEEMNIFRKASFSPSNFCEVSETEVALSMVENRKGVAFIPASQLEEGKGIAFSLAPEEIYHIAVAYRKDTMLTGALREFSMLLLENYDAYAG
jgi:DNA-binding transcriptional LysR family regulator